MRTEYREGVRHLVVGKDFRAFLDYSRRGVLGPVKLLRSVVTARVFPYFDRRNPLPFVMAVIRGLWRRLVYWRKKAWHGMRRRGRTRR